MTNSENPILELSAETCQDIKQSSQKEWLVTNGLGGFASGTVAGLNARRYHGLFLSSAGTARNQFMLVNKIEESLILDKRRFDLSANQYPGSIYPQGFKTMVRFRLDPWPIFTYQIAGIEIEKSIFMPYGRETTVISYRANTTCSMTIRIMLTGRKLEDIHQENALLNPKVLITEERLTLHPYTNMPEFYIFHNALDYRSSPHWYRNIEYPLEKQLGLEHREDYFSPGELTFSLHPAKESFLVLTTEESRQPFPNALALVERKRRANITSRLKESSDIAKVFAVSSDAFIVRDKKDTRCILSGYPWSRDNLRDSLISFHGLFLTMGRIEEAKTILKTFSSMFATSMEGKSNNFPIEIDSPLDTPLWYVMAVHAYYEKTRDKNLIREIWPTLIHITKQWSEKPRDGIRLDTNGLITWDTDNKAYTWMNAMTVGKPVTPRKGKPVEIESLWINTLIIISQMASDLGKRKDSKNLSSLANKAQKAFIKQFWNESKKCLIDVVSPSGNPDATVRPNQIFAVSLPHNILPTTLAKSVIQTVQEKLLTPFGLRTLAPDYASYKSNYLGDSKYRDESYHQGSVCPWLLGPFITAYLKIYGKSSKNIQRAREWLHPLRDQLTDTGISYISEIFDGDPPHEARGCIALTRNTAEIMRVMFEELDGEL